MAPKIWISDFVMIFFGHVVVYVLFSNLFGSGIFKPSCIKFKKFGGNIAQLLCFDLYKNRISRQIDSSLAINRYYQYYLLVWPSKSDIGNQHKIQLTKKKNRVWFKIVSRFWTSIKVLNTFKAKLIRVKTRQDESS